jgi:hypothetical protein
MYTHGKAGIGWHDAKTARGLELAGVWLLPSMILLVISALLTINCCISTARVGADQISSPTTWRPLLSGLSIVPWLSTFRLPSMLSELLDLQQTGIRLGSTAKQ